MTTTSTSGQIPLALDTQQQPGFELFVAGRNHTACETVRSIAAGELQSRVFLWGGAGTGITHLLQAACKLAAAPGRQAVYIPLREHAALAPDMLEDMELPELVCLDDLDRIAGNPAWEQSVVHLYNRRRDAMRSLIIGSHTAPRQLECALPDLQSRLVWDLVYHLEELDDADKITVLQQRAGARSFNLPRDVAEYLVKRVRRDLPYLVQVLERLQQATLVEQRKLTVPFVRSLLKTD